MAIDLASIPDRLYTTINDLNEGKITGTYKYSDYVALRLIWGSGGANETIKGGTQWEKRVRMRASTSTRMTRFMEGTPYNRTSLVEVCKYDYRNLEDKSIVYDNRDEIFQKGKQAIIDEVEDVMMPGAEEGFANLLEDQTFGQPTNSSDTLSFAGLRFLCGWVASGSVDTTGGFNGQTTYYGDASSTTTIGTIDASLAKNRNWRSFVATHNGTFDSTCRKTLRRALTVTNFRGINGGKAADKSGRPGGRCVVFLNTTFALDYEDDANKASDDLDGDLSKFNGQLYFRSVPLIRTEALDADAYSPIIGINTRWTYGLRAKNMWMYYSKPMPVSVENNHTFVQPLDGTGVLVCENRRAGIFNIHLGR